MIHSFIKLKTESKKLQFGAEKCKKLHVGKLCEEFKCQELYIDNWKEVLIENTDDGKVGIEDCLVGEEVMEEKSEEKYLGDVISNDGRNLKNIKVRVAKGKGIVNNIMTYLEGIPFGKIYFQIAVILRNSLLVSSMLFNSEAWYNVTNAELELLETVDLLLLRRILKAPDSTPKEMLYLELGCMPFREMIRQRRLSYLFYILHENPESIIYKVFETQMKYRTSKDWATTILADLEELKLNVTIAEIKSIRRGTYMNMIRKSIRENTFEKLNMKQSSHSKVNKWKHTMFKMQNYLMPNRAMMTQDDCQLIFKLRCRVTKIKTNLNGLFDTMWGI